MRQTKPYFDLDAELLQIEIKPEYYIEDSEVYLKTGEHAQKLEDWEEALESYAKAIELLTKYYLRSNNDDIRKQLIKVLLTRLNLLIKLNKDDSAILGYLKIIEYGEENIPPLRFFQAKPLFKKLEYNFTRSDLFISALTVPLTNKDNYTLVSNGDLLINQTIKNYLSKFKTKAEERQEKEKFYLHPLQLAQITKQINLNSLVIMSADNIRKNKHNNTDVLASALKGLIGAIFEDSNHDKNIVELIIIKLWNLASLFSKTKSEFKQQTNDVINLNINLFKSILDDDFVTTYQYLKMGANPQAVFSYSFRPLSFYDILPQKGPWFGERQPKVSITTCLDTLLRYPQTLHENTLEITKVLLENKADPNHHSLFPYSLLHEMCVYDPLYWPKSHIGLTNDITRLLCIHKADIHIRRPAIRKLTLFSQYQLDNNFTPLETAILIGNPEKVELLLEYKADPTLKHAGGKTAWHFTYMCIQAYWNLYKESEASFHKATREYKNQQLDELEYKSFNHDHSYKKQLYYQSLYSLKFMLCTGIQTAIKDKDGKLPLDEINSTELKENLNKQTKKENSFTL